MNQHQNDFNRLRIELRLFLDSFIHAFSVAEAVAELNDDFFEGTMALAEVRSLRRIIDDLQPDDTGCSIIKSCLALIENKSKAFGVDAMAYEAAAIQKQIDAAGEDESARKVTPSRSWSSAL